VSEIQKAYRLYLAIKQVIAEKSLDGLTIKCFDIIKELDTTACLALSLLNTMGFPRVPTLSLNSSHRSLLINRLVFTFSLILFTLITPESMKSFSITCFLELLAKVLLGSSVRKLIMSIKAHDRR